MHAQHFAQLRMTEGDFAADFEAGRILGGANGP